MPPTMISRFWDPSRGLARPHCPSKVRERRQSAARDLGIPKGNDLGVCVCPPGTQENYTSNESPARELPDGTKIFGVPGRERGFFYKSSSLVKYVAVLSIFSTQRPTKGPNAPRSRPRALGTSMPNKTSPSLAPNTRGLGFGTR